MRDRFSLLEGFALKVVNVITGLGRGGAEGALFRLCVESPAAVRMVVVSLTDHGVHGEFLQRAGVEVVALEIRSPLSAPWALLRLWRMLIKDRPDVVQTWMYHSDLLGGIAARIAGVPVCWGIRQANLSRGIKRSTKFVAKICGWLSKIVPAHAISCSERAVQAHRQYGYRVSMTVVPNGYDLSRWQSPELAPTSRSAFGLAESDLVLAHAARAHPQKDHANLALAFSKAYRQDPRLKLLLCGTGLEDGSPYLQALPFTAEARLAVRAVGPRDDLPQLWHMADAFVLSSASEGFPNVVAEAMASGLPAIVTDVGDAALIVADTGIVVPPNNPAALAAAMLRMADLPKEERRGLGQAAAARVAENYTVDRMVDGFMRVWQGVLSRKNA
ncbi:glycosyltransferase [Thermomonas fusca]|uniref:Glycosyltransferase n=1 Tax=Thermomonas fusca TaxID=215690 RepID=A0A5R9PF33_9GAMM|nr:glycosyltransferase [Thermomonas fusca]TLX21358.1 glycosyltransferase [Thermomonas fusca]